MAAARQGWETIGILGGFEGLLPPVAQRPLSVREADAVLGRGGTILGTSSRGRFTDRSPSGRQTIAHETVEEAARAARGMRLEALICIGGDGSLRIAQALSQAGVPVIGVPKTIDNDLPGDGRPRSGSSPRSLWPRMPSIAWRSTAESHQRVMVLEVMGRHAGWIAAHAGVAGGANVILIPEIRFDWATIGRFVQDRGEAGLTHTLVVAAEGARAIGGRYVMRAGRGGPPGERRLGGIGARVAAEVQRRTGREARAMTLGHLQRGGPPIAWDRQLCTRFGVAAVEAVVHGHFGTMIASRGSVIAPVPLADGVGRIRTVPVDGELVHSARAIGISFGD